MQRSGQGRDWFPLGPRTEAASPAPSAEAFRSEWIDFRRGIRVGRLEPHERITRILKHRLETTYRTPFVTDRWGRGVYWQWICWLPRANREAKPLSSDVNFGCAKFFIAVERNPPVFKSGLQVERGPAGGPSTPAGTRLRADWDWHRLLRACRPGSALDRELKRLISGEGFTAEVGDWEANTVFTKANFRSARQIREAALRCPRSGWAGFQLFYPMSPGEVHRSSGEELVRAIGAVFDAVVPAMNACMQIALTPGARRPPWNLA